MRYLAAIIVAAVAPCFACGKTPWLVPEYQLQQASNAKSQMLRDQEREIFRKTKPELEALQKRCELQVERYKIAIKKRSELERKRGRIKHRNSKEWRDITEAINKSEHPQFSRDEFDQLNQEIEAIRAPLWRLFLEQQELRDRWQPEKQGAAIRRIFEEYSDRSEPADAK